MEKVTGKGGICVNPAPCPPSPLLIGWLATVASAAQEHGLRVAEIDAQLKGRGTAQNVDLVLIRVMAVLKRDLVVGGQPRRERAVLLGGQGNWPLLC